MHKEKVDGWIWLGKLQYSRPTQTNAASETHQIVSILNNFLSSFIFDMVIGIFYAVFLLLLTFYLRFMRICVVLSIKLIYLII